MSEATGCDLDAISMRSRCDLDARYTVHDAAVPVRLLVGCRRCAPRPLARHGVASRVAAGALLTAPESETRGPERLRRASRYRYDTATRDGRTGAGPPRESGENDSKCLFMQLLTRDERPPTPYAPEPGAAASRSPSPSTHT